LGVNLSCAPLADNKHKRLNGGKELHVLVCGGAGYIGSHTVRKLQQAGFNVLVMDNLVKGHLPAIGDTPFIRADITKKQDIEQNKYLTAIILTR